jgi:bacteriocin-like protein
MKKLNDTQLSNVQGGDVSRWMYCHNPYLNKTDKAKCREEGTGAFGG